MHEPAGVRKSAVARTCANFLVAEKRLGAAVFLSSRDNPGRFFCFNLIQIVIQAELHGNNLNRRLQRDATLVIRLIAKQVWDLLMHPISQLHTKGAGIGEQFIIIGELGERVEKYAEDGK
ncbi:hypothetical protein P691DRAFT_810144 [Macrolepiota fuliginosa MF-IS2]|uniref:Uncharacterized protein n=1 Tax=Macrolepiota fuliginosa MF-IS2 TaxID=1400762 RepID=A0A9P5X3K1_9AGAR|nr:hypothetical protein P691DRAFT_810144 [Macrolepiota fuliginosa MF-IS2]